MSEAAKWYVVHTYSGYENKVKANIEKTIENRHLEDQILEVRVPLQDVVEMKNGTSRQVQKKMFPGYVLLNMVMNDDTWYVVRNTRGVTGFVGPGSKPVPLTEEEMMPLGIQKPDIFSPSHKLGSQTTSNLCDHGLIQKRLKCNTLPPPAENNHDAKNAALATAPLSCA